MKNNLSVEVPIRIDISDMLDLHKDDIPGTVEITEEHLSDIQEWMAEGLQPGGFGQADGVSGDAYNILMDYLKQTFRGEFTEMELDSYDYPEDDPSAKR